MIRKADERAVPKRVVAAMRGTGWRYEAKSDGFVKWIQGRGAARKIWVSAASAAARVGEVNHA